MAKYYAVKKGRKIGIFFFFLECESMVKGFKGALYKSFSSLEDAQNYLNEQTPSFHNQGLIAYVDGSFNQKTGEYGYGCVLIDGQQVILKVNGKGKHPDYVSMRNVAGEIAGAHQAICYAIEHQYPMICIYYDYEGIEKWANHTWTARRQGTQAYQTFIDESRQKIEIHFMKVLAHSGDLYNEMADLLAKKAVGIS